MKDEPVINPMHSPPWPMHLSPRCRGRSKRTGQPCRSPAVKGWKVCRMHGAGGGAPEGRRNGRYRTGLFTAELANARRQVRALAQLAEEAEEAIEEQG